MGLATWDDWQERLRRAVEQLPECFGCFRLIYPNEGVTLPRKIRGELVEFHNDCYERVFEIDSDRSEPVPTNQGRFEL